MYLLEKSFQRDFNSLRRLIDTGVDRGFDLSESFESDLRRLIQIIQQFGCRRNHHFILW